jgi:hypothetical protein
MLMTRIGRWNQVLVVVLAIAIAGLPLIHKHPVIPGGDDLSLSAAVTIPCAVCATTNARVIVAVPQISAPAPTVRHLVALPLAVPSIHPAAPLASRAPPSA